jgi:hypothetical protein
VYGPTVGHAPNARARSFEASVFTDADGFRVPGPRAAGGGRPAVLVMGDSVAFGAGVEEPLTFVGRLRAAHPSREFLNAAVIGYTVRDYENVARHLLPRHPEVQEALLVFCLNDLTDSSAALIRESLERVDRPANLVDRARNVRLLGSFNATLRSHSKLYLWVKNALTDTPQRYFRADLALYDVSDERLAELLAPLERLWGQLERAGVPLTVVLVPYEAQLRLQGDDVLRPQRRLSAFFDARGISYVDLTAPLARAGADGTELYLPGDAMHLCAAGHRAVFELLHPRLAASGGRAEGGRS